MKKRKNQNIFFAATFDRRLAISIDYSVSTSSLSSIRRIRIRNTQRKTRKASLVPN